MADHAIYRQGWHKGVGEVWWYTSECVCGLEYDRQRRSETEAMMTDHLVDSRTLDDLFAPSDTTPPW